MSNDLKKITLYNTESRKKEAFKTQEPGKVSIYSCGPTVYGQTHIGNAFAAIVPDLFSRVLKRAGFEVTLIQNVTDIDDKIIAAAKEKGEEPGILAKRFTDIYLKELKELGNKPVDHRPLATEHIPEMVEMIQQLIDKDFAYSADTPYGTDVYFDVAKYKDYGKLSNRDSDDMLVGARIEPGEAKNNPTDFTLWKAAKPDEPSWESPWGNGRPGWHIECSAMIHKKYPKGVDIHMGGLDLIFPHHENEIAQTECCTGHKIARYWAHNGTLVIGKEKMSKSLGNFFTTQEFLKSFGAETFRLMIFQNHYRSPIDFSEETIFRSEALVERIYHAKARFEVAQKSNATQSEYFKTAVQKIDQALFDDFNSAKALGFILKDMRTCFKEDTHEHWLEWGHYALPILNEILGVAQNSPDAVFEEIRSKRFERMEIDQEQINNINERLAMRTQLRSDKKFDEADNIRKELEKEGFLIMDSPDGTVWSTTGKIES